LSNKGGGQNFWYRLFGYLLLNLQRKRGKKRRRKERSHKKREKENLTCIEIFRIYQNKRAFRPKIPFFFFCVAKKREFNKKRKEKGNLEQAYIAEKA
jgi:hypothetical protein